MKISSGIFLRKDAVNKIGEHPIYFQCTFNGERIRLSLGVSILPEHFDSNLQRVKKSLPNMPGVKKAGQTAKDYNILIEKMLGKIYEIVMEARLSDKEFTKEEIEEILISKSSKYNFVDFMEQELEKRFKKQLIEKGTYKKTKSTVNKLREFNKNVKFSDLTPEFVEDFDKWLEKKYGNGINTRHGRHRGLKAYINIALDKGIKFTNPYDKYKVKKAKGSITYLHPRDLRKLEQLYNRKELEPKYQYTLGAFLFSCYTSLRISDIGRVERKHIIHNFLVFTPYKTRKFEKTVKIPLSKKAKQFIGGMGDVFFSERYTDQKINAHLKVIAKSIGIQMNLSFHVGRHTFATKYIALGGKIENLQKIMGHADISTTQIYAEVLDESLVKDIALFDAEDSNN